MKIAVIYFEILCLTFTFSYCLSASPTASEVKNKFYWYNRNYELIKQKLSLFNLKPENLPRVKNVILFVGDGMGLTTVTASRTYKQQKMKNEEEKLAFDDFPATAFVKTDTANSQISESAAAATALFCGVKTNFENLGVDASAEKDACKNIESHTTSIVSWAQSKNLKTGFVTTTRITHATPAALYAHSRRHMEDDSKSDAHCKDIARQLIEDEPGKNFNVIMGGGLRGFLSEREAQGRRRDNRSLTDEWMAKHPKGVFVTDRWQMLNVTSDVDHVLGIFAKSHMHFNADRDKELEPSLAEMTETAIEVLKRNNKRGFLLVVEAGKIDLAHHYNNAFRALDDTLALDEAVSLAVKKLDLTESLIVVTADHGSPMVYSGYATPKDYSILGMDKYVSNVDKKPYQLLLYSSGFGFDSYNESAAVTDHRNAYHKAAIPSTWANHAGSDVPLYAVGSLATILFGGTMDQTYVSHGIAFAMCLFKYQMRCMSQEYVHKPFEGPRDKKVSSIHLLQQKLNREKFEQAQKEMNRNTENSNRLIATPRRNYNSFRHKIYSATSESPQNFESSSGDDESSPASLTEVIGTLPDIFDDFNTTEGFNVTEIDVSMTSDLVGNLTEIDSGVKKPSSLSILVLILVIIIRLVR